MFPKNKDFRKIDIFKIFWIFEISKIHTSKIFKIYILDFCLEIFDFFSKFSFLKKKSKTIFFENVFLYDEKRFFVRIFFVIKYIFLVTPETI